MILPPFSCLLSVALSLPMHRRFMDHLQDTRFSGASGYVQFEDKKADRTGIVDIMQFVNNISHMVGSYHHDKPAKERMTLNSSLIYWVDGEKPIDGRPGRLVVVLLGSSRFI